MMMTMTMIMIMTMTKSTGHKTSPRLMSFSRVDFDWLTLTLELKCCYELHEHLEWLHASLTESPLLLRVFATVGSERKSTAVTRRIKPATKTWRESVMWDNLSGATCQQTITVTSKSSIQRFAPSHHSCRQDVCNCWIECENKKCEKYGGRCSVQQPRGYLRSKYWCDKWVHHCSTLQYAAVHHCSIHSQLNTNKSLRKTKCNCWMEACKPGSVSKTCDSGRGQCYPPGSDVPDNMVRDGWCDK